MDRIEGDLGASKRERRHIITVREVRLSCSSNPLSTRELTYFTSRTILYYRSHLIIALRLEQSDLTSNAICFLELVE